MERWTPFTQAVTLDMVTTNFNSGQLKTQMKKMAAQIDFYISLNAFLSPELFGV